MGGSPLLAVPLHLADRPRPGVVRILAELPASPPLAEQIPALIQPLLERVEAGLLVGGKALANGPRAELVLLRDQLVDPADDLCFVHGAVSTTAARSRPSRAPATPDNGRS